MTFSNPSYLWALAGLAIPFAIHLLSRKEGKVIRVGSIRHVEESNTSQFKSIRLNEILLLLLRMLMVIALAFFMSGAQCSGVDPEKKLIYAEHGINVDSLVNKGYELHEIPEGPYWSLAEKINESSFETIVVSYSKAENFRGERISLHDNVKWITTESQGSLKEFQALAWQAGDSIFVRTGKTSGEITSFATDMKIPDSIQIIKPHAINIKSNNKIVLAALNVLRKQYHLPITNTQQPTTNNQQLTTNNQQLTTIEIVPGIGALVENISPTEIHINKPLDQDIALNENLVIELFKVLYPELQKPATLNKDLRVLPDEFAFSSSRHIVTSSSRNIVTSSSRHIVTSDIGKYLILLFILSLAAERFVAIRRNQ